jgi:metal-dependent amidase/aminoacylase/carboxypeptidase family protein
MKRPASPMQAVFQPGQETAEGARAMIDDGLFDRFPMPAVVLGRHVMVGPAGAVAERTGAITSAADSLPACSDAERMVRCRKPASTPS